jgi:hypothetical protein
MTGSGMPRRVGLVPGSVCTIWKRKMEEMREYLDDAYLMDIYSFPEYQVKVEFVITSDDLPHTCDSGRRPKEVVDTVAWNNLRRGGLCLGDPCRNDQKPPWMKRGDQHARLEHGRQR